MTADPKRTLLEEKLRRKFKDGVIDTLVSRGEVTHLVKKEALREICKFLKTDAELKMNYLVDVLGVDYAPAIPRFEVVYHLYSIPKRHRLRLKVKVDEGQPVPSIIDIWPAADWPERETYDMYGTWHPTGKDIH
jgi:NADH-quinone oxidoreductase subunit C